MVWIDGIQAARVFKKDTTGTEQPVQPDDRALGRRYAMEYESAQICDATSASNYWTVHIYGPGTKEYYYPEDSGDSYPDGALAAVEDRFANFVCLSYDKSDRLAEIEAPSGATLTYDYDTTNEVHIEYRHPGTSGASTEDSKASFYLSSGKLSYWRAPHHQSGGSPPKTNEYTYGTAAYDSNWIITKKAESQRTIKYEYDGTTTSETYGYLTKTVEDPSGTPLEHRYHYGFDDEDTASPPVWKTNKTINERSPTDSTSLATDDGVTHYVLGSGYRWKKIYHGEDNDDTLVVYTDHTFEENVASGNYIFGLGQIRRTDGDGDLIHSDDTRPHRWMYRFAGASTASIRAGRILEYVDPANRIVRHRYDEGDSCGGGRKLALVSQVVHTRDDSGGQSHNQTYSYVCKGPSSRIKKLTERTIFSSTSLKYKYQFDDNGLLTRLESPAGIDAVTEYEYFSSTSTSKANGEFPFKLKVRTDAEARKSGASGGNKTQTRYDEFGRVDALWSESPGGTQQRRTDYDYDVAGNLTKVTEDGTGGVSDLVTNYYYDTAGRLTRTEEDLNGDAGTVYDYSPQYRMTRERRCDDSSQTNCVGYLAYEYDDDGRITKQSDANGTDLYYDYDKRDRLVELSTSSTFADCTSSPCLEETYDYTVDGRMTRQAWTEKITSAGLDESNEIRYWYDYDDTSGTYSQPTGRLMGVSTQIDDSTNGWRHVEYVYTNENQGSYVDDLLLTKEVYKSNSGAFFSLGPSDSEGFVLSHEYDKNHGLTKIKAGFPDTGSSTDQTVKFSYFDDGALKEICTSEDNSTGVCTGDELVTTYSYWDNGWVKRINHDRSGLTGDITEVPKFTFGTGIEDAYDYDGNVVAFEECPSTGTCTGTDYDFSYDDFNRLTIGDISNGDEDYDYYYDEVGNRTKRVEDTTSTTYTFNYLNQLTSATTGKTTINYCYDDNGNLEYVGTSSCASSPNAIYEWDHRNRLVQRNYSKTIGSFAYDPQGRRLREYRAGDGYQYLWDGVNPIASYHDDGSVREYYVYGPGADELISKWADDGEDRFDYLRGYTNEVVRVVDHSNNIVKRVMRYGPFGEERDSSTAYFDRFTYTGRETDEKAEGGSHELMYYRARWYDPEIGRFMSRDSLSGTTGWPALFNSYSYTANSPVKFNDPSGKAPNIARPYLPSIPGGRGGEGPGSYTTGCLIASFACEAAPPDNCDTLGCDSGAGGIMDCVSCVKECDLCTTHLEWVGAYREGYFPFLSKGYGAKPARLGAYLGIGHYEVVVVCPGGTFNFPNVWYF